MTTETEGGLRNDFEDLKARGLRAIEAGRIEEAAAIFDRALHWAEEHGELGQVELAICNRAAALIELRRGASELPRLREILVRNGDRVACRVAAYNIARHYEINKEYKKALFYARIARDRSALLDRPDWLASSYNQVGNTLLAESLVAEAFEHYTRAIELMPGQASPARARILDNLGYCRLLQGHYREGYALLYQSLSMLRRFRAERYQISTRLDLCFAHLETGRYRHARRQGIRALALAEEAGEVDSIKNALYLLGEAAHLDGDAELARGYFARLQREFFPDTSYLPQFLLAVDVRKLINLHA